MSNELAFYDKISDPLAAVEKLGTFIAKSGMFGCDKVEQGQVLALACLCERKSPFELLQNYHIIDGRLSKRADAMLADFRRVGGSWVWVKSDATEAVISLTFQSFKDFQVKYSIEDAKRAGLVREKSGWAKNPDAMLRARVISKSLRMVAPEIVSGVYTPEEVSDFDVPAPTLAAAAVPLLGPGTTPPPSKPVAVAATVKPAVEKPVSAVGTTPPLTPSAANAQPAREAAVAAPAASTPATSKELESAKFQGAVGAVKVPSPVAAKTTSDVHAPLTLSVAASAVSLTDVATPHFNVVTSTVIVVASRAVIWATNVAATAPTVVYTEA